MRFALPILLWLALAAPASAEIRVIDVRTGATSTPVTDDAALVGWSDDGTALLLKRADALHRLVLATGAVTPEPEREHAGPGGRWIDTELQPPAAVVRAADGRELARYPLPSFWSEVSATWSRDGGRVALSGSGFFAVLDTADGAWLLERDRGYDFTSQAFAPDGSALLASDERRIVRFDLPGQRATTVYRARRDTYPAAAWGAAGRVAFTVPGGVGVPGFPTVHVSTDAPALWSGDGTTLRYVTASTVLCSYPVNGLSVGAPGQPPRVLVDGVAASVGAAEWSPVGATLATQVAGGGSPAEQRGKRRPWPKRVARIYHMSTRGGDAALRRIVQRAARSLRRGAGREATLLRVRQDYYRLPKRYDEALDTIVREAVANELDRWLVAAGFEPIEAYDEITYC